MLVKQSYAIRFITIALIAQIPIHSFCSPIPTSYIPTSVKLNLDLTDIAQASELFAKNMAAYFNPENAAKLVDQAARQAIKTAADELKPGGAGAQLIETTAEAVASGALTGIANSLDKGGADRINQATNTAVKAFFEGATGGIADTLGKEGIAAANMRYAIQSTVRDVSGEVKEAFRNGGAADNAMREWTGAVDRVSGDLAKSAERRFGNASARVFLKHGLVIIGTIGGAAALYYLSKYGWKRYFENHPKLLLSKPTLFSRLKRSLGFSTPEPTTMVLEPQLAKQLTRFIETTQATRTAIKNGNTRAEYTNLILCGPPGTGKTMFAKKLADESGMKLAAISAAGLASCGTEAIAEIDKLFAMDDVVIIIDEVDSLLGKRNEINLSSDSYKIINHILGYTGKASNKRILVMTTNLVENLDPALIDRASIIYVGLPNLTQRARMISHAAQEQLFNKENGQNFVNQAERVLSKNKIDELASATEGMSNRNLCNIINMIYTNALKYGITHAAINEAVALEQQKQVLINKVIEASARLGHAAAAA